MAPADDSDWPHFSRSSQWIEPAEDYIPEPGRRPAYLLRSPEFRPSRRIVQAELVSTAHGVYEVFVNGERVGDRELTPGFTAYRDRLQVQTWDVTTLVQPAENVLAAIISDGWFRGRHGFERHADGYGDRTAFIAELRLAYDDGSVETVGTGDGWMSSPGHIVRADLMDGQAVDFRLLDPHWSAPGSSAEGWREVRIAGGALYDNPSRFISEQAAPVRRIETLRPVEVTRPRSGVTVVDFGQNINGWVRLTELGPAGTHIVLTHGEILDPSGEVSVENIRAFDFASGEPLPAGQVDEVISAGRADDIFEPRHTTHGFRYVQLDGFPGDLHVDSISAVVVHTDLQRVGSLRTSDDRLNALYDATVWSLRDNVCDIPTDCPQRERAGFTGDWQIFIDTATQIFDVRAFSEKWLGDLAADQWDDGRVPTVVPNPAGRGLSGRWLDDISAGSAGWGDAAVIVPWELWRAYGDLDALNRALPAAVRWVDFAARSAAESRHPDRVASQPIAAPYEKFLWDTGFHFGEWLEPGVPPALDPTLDRGIVATAFLHRSAELLSRMLRIAGDSRVDDYRSIAEGAKHAWQSEYLSPDGSITEESQANYVRGLAFGLIPPDLRAAAVDRLVKLIRARDGHLSTGFLSTGLLLPVLAEHGRIDAAYALLFSTGIPSWLEMIDRGASTIWEWWDGVDGDKATGSLNHYSKGAVVSFLFNYVAGIRLPENPGPDEAAYRRILIAPQPGRAGLTHASAELATANGLVSSRWTLENGTFLLDVHVPDGSTAIVKLPDGTSRTIEPGPTRLSCLWSRTSTSGQLDAVRGVDASTFLADAARPAP